MARAWRKARINNVMCAIVATALAVVAYVDMAAAAEALTPSAAIVVDGDAGFASAALPVRGTGTAADPFVIEHLDIDASGSAAVQGRGSALAGACVTLMRTTAHVVLSGLRCRGAAVGVLLDEAANVAVEGFYADGLAGVDASGAADRNATAAAGVVLADARSISVVASTFKSL
eukprot:CAMPEP_0203821316 /NCGR_PEP_ID=MMETSP0115-20131106/42772_1 /ASSEMBLY_ACC=CAM_ASM_000227 /TAXON_ID=33651 /ORGANISM="Bicosoecid sp, Strain ms1" /LENGTH=173 /DNA_ID=CAMNT_0050730337 /DNA_START=10 /DNA_END=528 /DNA_ORIENTATION=-